MTEGGALVQHIEKHLGVIQGGWSRDAFGVAQDYTVVRTASGPTLGTECMCTVGLGHHGLRSRVSTRVIHHELLMIFRSASGVRGRPAAIQDCARRARESGFAFLRGDIVRAPGRAIAGTRFDALYVSLPAYLPDSFASCIEPGVGEIVFAWLVPVYESEARYVAQHGWEAFENILEENDPDLLDDDREPIA